MSRDFGGSVVETNKQPLPDLDTLLSDIHSTLEQQTYYNQLPIGMDTAPLGETYTGFEIEQPFSFQEELTLYDDMPTEQKPNVAELQKQMNLPLAHVNSPMPPKEATTLTVMPCSVSHDIEMDEARKEVDNVCLQLGIPAGRF